MQLDKMKNAGVHYNIWTFTIYVQNVNYLISEHSKEGYKLNN